MQQAVHSRRARAALARMPEVDPAIAALSLWCAHRDVSGATRTMGETIGYGPGFDTRPIQDQVGLLAHHVMHVALRHSARAADMAVRLGDAFDANLYNLAGDAIVNEALLQAGHALPRPAVRAADLLRSLPGDAPKPEDILSHWDTDRLFLALRQSGSATRAKAEAYAEQKQFQPDLEAGEPEGEEDGADTWAARLDQACDAGRVAGLGIGSLLASFADLPRPGVAWERHLRRLLARAVSHVPRRSHKRPAGRWVATERLARQTNTPSPAYQPGFARDQRRPRIVIALDSSSSITDQHLQLLSAEAISIARRSDAELHALVFDIEVHLTRRVRQPNDLLKLEFRRGGGTDFAPVFSQARDMDPSALVMLTDLDADAGLSPKYPVIWATPEPPQNQPAFGTVLVMNR